MKKLVFFAVIVLCGALVFAGGSKEEMSNVIKVGATPEPHAEMLKLVVDDLAKEGYD